ncbi:STM3941 family protein [Carboxylicivirga sp. M1479]|uniref:STM3941 family protein n=1 Tax=Carboxylicivirga sp. M1479 TaxID=2594476 RepID=UPI0011780B2E|nr:STM3941 family protein [Carboxylicivirga sp. M1479]TRX65907.1 hypothetical protein FNN09_16070 [Carboxylicivirga sp. M1479]
MNNNEQIEIALSKMKLGILLLGCIVFVALGIGYIVKAQTIDIPILGNPILLYSLGSISIIVFGFALITILQKFLDRKAGLVINNEGIIDNSSGVSLGLVLWSDIEEIKVKKVMNQSFLMLMVKNPQDYIDRAENSFKRKSLKANYKKYGSPIGISTNSLKSSHNNLHGLLTEKLKENKSQ